MTGSTSNSQESSHHIYFCLERGLCSNLLAHHATALAMAKRTWKSQVAASWTWVETCVVWQTLMDSQVYSQVHARKIFQGYMPVFHRLIGCFNKEWTSLNLCWLGLDGQTAKNFRWLAFRFHLDQTERKSSQINARARPGQMESQVDPSFQIASSIMLHVHLLYSRHWVTFSYLQVHIARFMQKD